MKTFLGITTEYTFVKKIYGPYNTFATHFFRRVLNLLYLHIVDVRCAK